MIIEITTEFIKLDQLLKYAGIAYPSLSLYAIPAIRICYRITVPSPAKRASFSLSVPQARHSGAYCKQEDQAYPDTDPFHPIQIPRQNTFSSCTRHRAASGFPG